MVIVRFDKCFKVGCISGSSDFISRGSETIKRIRRLVMLDLFSIRGRMFALKGHTERYCSKEYLEIWRLLKLWMSN